MLNRKYLLTILSYFLVYLGGINHQVHWSFVFLPISLICLSFFFIKNNKMGDGKKNQVKLDSIATASAPIQIDKAPEIDSRLESFLSNEWDIMLRNALDGGANSILACHVLKKTSELLQRGETQIMKMTESARNVNQVTQELYTISNSINDISRASRMVAINLSVEAARVTRGGETFRIIAQELQRMAARVDQLTTDVGKRIVTIDNQAVSNKNICDAVRSIFNNMNLELNQFKNLMLRIEVLSTSQAEQLREIERKIS